MRTGYRWYVTFVFFLFMLFHQADKLLISPLVTPIMEDFRINEAQMGAVSTLALVVAALLYPLWGYLYDRFARAKLLSLASLIWGSTTWLSALAPTFPTFMVTRATTGIDDSSYPGIFSLLSDYFRPDLRGKVYGLLQISGPLGFMLGTVLASMLGEALGWRTVFFVTGTIGILMAPLILFTVREVPRGRSEPQMRGLDEVGDERINWQDVRLLMRNRSLLLLMAQGFFGVFPWNVLTFWFFRYLGAERGYAPQQAMLIMIVAIVGLSVGYFLGGALGDRVFQRTPRGRVIVSGLGVLAGAVLLFITMMIPIEQTGLFVLFLALTAVTMSVASPNVISMVFDITVPEVRSTAQALRKLFEDGGSAIAPFLAGLIAVQASLHLAIMVICIGTWLLCAALFLFLDRTMPEDIESLRHTMQERADQLA